MKRINKKVGLLMLLSVLAVLLIWGCWKVSTTQNNDEGIKLNTNQTLVEVHSCWRDYTLEDAVASANIIIRGKVLAKSETKTQDIMDTNGNIRGQSYYKDVTVEIVEAIKGVVDTDTVTYVEPGGETESVLCVYDDVTPLNIGEECIFILTKDGYFLNPATILQIEDETVKPAMSLQYSNNALSRTGDGASVYVDDFVDVIKGILSSH